MSKTSRTYEDKIVKKPEKKPNIHPQICIIQIYGKIFIYLNFKFLLSWCYSVTENIGYGKFKTCKQDLAKLSKT